MTCESSLPRKRYRTVYFNLCGCEIEAMLIGYNNGWFTLKTFFTGNIYKRRVGQVWNNRLIDVHTRIAANY